MSTQIPAVSQVAAPKSPAIPVITATTSARAPTAKIVKRPQRIENPVPPEGVEDGEDFIAFLRWRDSRLFRVRCVTSGRRASRIKPATTTTTTTIEAAMSISGRNPSVAASDSSSSRIRLSTLITVYPVSAKLAALLACVASFGVEVNVRTLVKAIRRGEVLV